MGVKPYVLLGRVSTKVVKRIVISHIYGNLYAHHISRRFFFKIFKFGLFDDLFVVFVNMG